eukprot:UN11590
MQPGPWNPKQPKSKPNRNQSFQKRSQAVSSVAPIGRNVEVKSALFSFLLSFFHFNAKYSFQSFMPPGEEYGLIVFPKTNISLF